MQAFGGNIRELITGGAPMNAEVEHFMKKIKFPFCISSRHDRMRTPDLLRELAGTPF